MPIVDLDFEEELKETNFPDLLSDVPTNKEVHATAAALPEHPRRKKSSTSRKDEKGRSKSDENKRVRAAVAAAERSVKEARATTMTEQKLVDVAADRTTTRTATTAPTTAIPKQSKQNMSLIVNVSNSKSNIKLTRLAVDPPVSPTSHTATSTSSSRNESKSSGKHTSSSYGTSSKLTSENVQKLTTPSLDPITPTTATSASTYTNKAETSVPMNAKSNELSKRTLSKNIKRDFIDQVSYVNAVPATTIMATKQQSHLSPKGTVVTTMSNSTSKSLAKSTAADSVAPLSPKGTVASNMYAKPSIPMSPVGNAATSNQISSSSPPLSPHVIKVNDVRSSQQSKVSKKELSPKPHEVDLQRVDSQGSIISSIHHDESSEDGQNSVNKIPNKNPDEAQDLLERARDRIARQRLVEQVKALEMIVERKNIELEQLNAQLRRAVETKSELVIAHNEIEKRHTAMIEKKEQNLIRMKQANIWLLEAQSIKEKELLNEIIRLTDLTRDNEMKRREELDDWERMHRNEMLEKDYMIAQLLEELRKLGVHIESPICSNSSTSTQHQQFRNNHTSTFPFDPTAILTGASKYFFH